MAASVLRADSTLSPILVMMMMNVLVVMKIKLVSALIEYKRMFLVLLLPMLLVMV